MKPDRRYSMRGVRVPSRTPRNSLQRSQIHAAVAFAFKSTRTDKRDHPSGEHRSTVPLMTYLALFIVTSNAHPYCYLPGKSDSTTQSSALLVFFEGIDGSCRHSLLLVPGSIQKGFCFLALV
jgi:hypothetical protein